jgi:hypothetical protein
MQEEKTKFNVYGRAKKIKKRVLGSYEYEISGN